MTIVFPTLSVILEWILWGVGCFVAFCILIEFIFWWAGARGD